MALIEKPGLYKNLSNEDYHQSKGVSNSDLKLLLPPNCPAIYQYQKLSGLYTRKEADHFTLGCALHTLTLEPETFDDRFMCVNEIPKRTSILGKDAHAGMLKKAGNREILDSQDYLQVKAMADSLTSHAMWQTLLQDRNTNNIEDSIAWIEPDSGALLRTRPDYYTEYNGQWIIVDIKTTKDVAPHSFSSSLYEYGYHRQGAMACDGLAEITGQSFDMVILFVISKQPPYLRRSYVITADAIEQGRLEYKRGARIYQNCLDSGIWPGYEEIIEDINLPNWVYRSVANE